MIPLLSVEELATDLSSQLDLSADGEPDRALLAVDLDAAGTASADDLAAAASSVRRTLALVVGIATTMPALGMDALLDALDVTLIAADAGAEPREVVAVEDPKLSLNALAAKIAATPRAAVTLGQVLRQTTQLDVRAGLAAEAAAYSVLLAGRELKSWLNTRGAARVPKASDQPVVEVERRGDILSVVLNRPERRNAVNAALRDQLVDALTIAIASPELRVELCGRGANFSSGGDIDEFGTATDVDSAYLIRLERHPGWLLHRLGDRVVVKVHGACIGAGIEMPSLARRIVATDDAYFALPEIAMGVIPGAGGTVGIPRRIGRWRTAWLALTGERIDAITALDWGLVDDVVSA